jgi:DNA-binding response OmpR family regulator
MGLSPRVLLVEDDEPLASQVLALLERAGFAAAWIRDGDEAIRAPFAEFELVILDVMLPGAYGLDILKRLRVDSAVPVLILSVRDLTAEKVRALELGADDYVTKPFAPEELLARIRARLRRPAVAAVRVEAGEMAIDLAGRDVRVEGRTIKLTPVEFALLAALAGRAGTAVSREWLARDIDSGLGGSVHAMEAHLCNLRRKLGAAGKRIQTVWGFGYKLDDGPPA